MRMTVAALGLGLAIVLAVYAIVTILAARELAAIGSPARYRSTAAMPNLHDSYYTVHLFGILQIAGDDSGTRAAFGSIAAPLPRSAKAGWLLAVGAFLSAVISVFLIFRHPDNAAAETSKG